MILFQYSISLVFLSIFFYMVLRYKNRHAVIYAVICLLISVLAYGYGASLAAPDVDHLELALEIEMIGFMFIPPLWFVAALTFGKKHTPTFLHICLIFSVPAFCFFLAMTADHHSLYYTNLHFVLYNGHMIYKMDRHIGYFIFTAYSYSLMLASAYIYFKIWRAGRFSSASPALYLLLGTLAPSLAYALYRSQILPVPYDITSFGFIALAGSYYFAFSRFNYLDLMSIARSEVFDKINEGILVTDEADRIIDYNTAAKRTFDWLNPGVLGRSIRDFESGHMILTHSAEHFYLQLWVQDELRYFSFSATSVHASQRFFSRYLPSKSIGRVYVFQDITEQKHTLDELHFMASHDALSGLYNRRKIMEEAENDFYRYTRYDTPLAVIMMDIDHFKHVNDRYGHLAGDIVIQNLAALCKERLRTSDCIGRYGGEEFLILLSETDQEQACFVAESIRSIVENSSVYYEGRVIRITVSMGLASTSSMPAGFTLNDLINASDQALFKSKASGRNKITCCDEAHDKGRT